MNPAIEVEEKTGPYNAYRTQAKALHGMVDLGRTPREESQHGGVHVRTLQRWLRPLHSDTCRLRRGLGRLSPQGSTSRWSKARTRSRPRCADTCPRRTACTRPLPRRQHTNRDCTASPPLPPSGRRSRRGSRCTAHHSSLASRATRSDACPPGTAAAPPRPLRSSVHLHRAHSSLPHWTLGTSPLRTCRTRRGQPLRQRFQRCSSLRLSSPQSTRFPPGRLCTYERLRLRRTSRQRKGCTYHSQPPRSCLQCTPKVRSRQPLGFQMEGFLHVE